MQYYIQTQPLFLLHPQPRKKKMHKVEQDHIKQNPLERADVAKQNP